MILEVPIKSDWLIKARKEAMEMGKLRQSITSGAGNLAGFIGEIAVQSVIGGTRKNTRDYDLVKDPYFIDVKSKRCTSVPLPNYACSIAAYNPHQKCTHYVFVRVLEIDYSRCWILGYMEKDKYFEAARFCRKGDEDPNDNRGWTFKADCYNLTIEKLKDINDLRSK